MLKLAVQGGVPLIHVFTSDLLHAQTVLEATLSVPVVNVKGNQLKLPWRSVCCLIGTPGASIVEVYKHAEEQESQLILINSEWRDGLVFDAGLLRVPCYMVEKFVKQYVPEHDPEFKGLCSALSGVNMVDVLNITRLATANGKSFSVESVRDIRHRYFDLSRGLLPVDLKISFYFPPVGIDRWLKLDGVIFDSDAPAFLQPRGLLFTGNPGTGKTLSAKHIAATLNLPLYQLDIGLLMDKYVGESEKQLQLCLAQLDRMAPCVVLMDEVEKLFNTSHDDSGIGGRILSGLLWWLQEHKSRVLTIMTTNNKRAIPLELYRPGRIDEVVEFNELVELVGKSFCYALVENFPDEYRPSHSLVRGSVSDWYAASQTNALSQAELTKRMVNLAKRIAVDKLKLAE